MSGLHWTIEDYVLVQQVHFENQMTLDMQCSLYVDNCAKMTISTYETSSASSITYVRSVQLH
jgi:hypothetical protein